MRIISIWVSVSLLLASILWGCVSERDIRSRAMERFVREGIYRNTLKGYSLAWPDDVHWKHHRNPEFDLLFDHVDGNSQILITALRPLVRRDFPDGFLNNLLERLGAVQIIPRDRKDLTSEGNTRFQISADVSLRMFSREDFSVQRHILADVRSDSRYWLAVIFISNDMGFERNRADFDAVNDSVVWLAAR